MDNSNQPTPKFQSGISASPESSEVKPQGSASKQFLSKNVVIFLVVAILLILSLGAYLVLSSQQNLETPQDVIPPQPSPSSNPDEITNWETYTNDEFGFEVRYPNQFMFFPRTERSFDIMNYDKFDPKVERGNMNGLRIFVAVDPDSYKNKQEALATIETEDELGKRTFVEEFLEESYGRIQYVYFRNSRWTSGSGTLLSGVFMPSHAIYDPHTGRFAIFQIQDPSGDFKKVTQQILSTFKFIDESEISWESAVELIRNCQVTMVAQDHNRNVGLTLKDGTSRSTIEPVIDMVLEEAQSASSKCGFNIDMVTE